MKRTILILISIATLAACSTKPCRCYLLESYGSVRVNKTYIDEETPCRELGYTTPNPDDSSFRYCTDWDTAEMSHYAILDMF